MGVTDFRSNITVTSSGLSDVRESASAWDAHGAATDRARQSAERLREVDLAPVTTKFRELNDPLRNVEAGFSSASHHAAKLTEGALALAGAFAATAHAVTAYTSAHVASTAAVVEHSGAMDHLVGIYRAARLALSPTLFTAGSIAAGVAVEEVIKLTIARDRLIQQDAILASRSGQSYSNVSTLGFAGALSGSGRDTYQSLFSGRNPSDLISLSDQFQKISDPIDRATFAVKNFGQNAEKVLPLLGDRLKLNTERGFELAQMLDTKARTSLEEFAVVAHRPAEALHGLADELRYVRDLAKEKIVLTIAYVLESAQGAFRDAERSRANIAAQGKTGGNFTLGGLPIPINANPIPSDLAFSQGALDAALGGLQRLQDALPLPPVSAGLASASNRVIQGRDSSLEGLQRRYGALQSSLQSDQSALPGALGGPLEATIRQRIVNESRAAQALESEIDAMKKATQAQEELFRTTQAAYASVRIWDTDATSTGVRRDGLRLMDNTTLAQVIAGTSALFNQSNPDVFESQQGFGTPFASRTLQNVATSLSLVGLRRLNPDQQADNATQFYSTFVQPQWRRSDQQQLATIAQLGRQGGASLAFQNLNAAQRSDADLQNELKTIDAELRVKEIHKDIYDIDYERFQAGLRAQQAEFEYSQKILSIKEQQKTEAENQAGSFFDALHSRTTGQYWRNFALGQERQLFTNVAGPVFGEANHFLGGLIPNTGALGTLLHGTVFDNANADPARQTAENTAKTASLLGRLLGYVTGNPDPNASATTGIPNISAAGASGVFNPSIFFGTGGLLGTGIGIPGATGSSTSSPLASLFGSGGGIGTSLFNSANGSGFSQFVAGLGAGGTNPLGAIFTGQASGPGWGAQLTTAQQVGVALGTAAALSGAGLGIASGISQGGIGGYTKAGSSALGAAAVLDPEPISKTVLGAVAAVTGIVGSLFGTGPQQRAKNIFNEVSAAQYLAPTALNVTQGPGGNYEDFDARGNLRTSNFSALPLVAQPYITSRVYNGQRTYYDAPGNVLSPFTPGPTGTGQTPVSNAQPQITVVIPGIQGFREFANRPENSAAIGESMVQHLGSGNGERFAAEIRHYANS